MPQDNNQGFGDETSARFLGQESVEYDSVGSPQYLGSFIELDREISGTVGDQTGKATVFFSFDLPLFARVRLRLLPVERWTDRFLQLSLLDPDRRAIALDADGYATSTDVSGTQVDESQARLPPGRYTFLIACTQWTSTRYRLGISISPIVLEATLEGRGFLDGVISKTIPPQVLAGALQGNGDLSGYLYTPPPAGAVSFRITVTSATIRQTSGGVPQPRQNFPGFGGAWPRSSPWTSMSAYEPVGAGGFYYGTLDGNSLWNSRTVCGFIRSKSTGLYTSLGDGTQGIPPQGIGSGFYSSTGGSGWVGPNVYQSSIITTYQWEYLYPDTSIVATPVEEGTVYYVVPDLPGGVYPTTVPPLPRSTNPNDPP
jgi:hypothetical protein